MWNIYANNQEAIAIVSTTKAISNAYVEFRNKERSGSNNPFTAFSAKLGDVVYVSDNQDLEIDQGDILFYKRKGFEHEKEARLVVKYDRVLPDEYWSFPLDINTFIERIIVSPRAPAWFVNLVKATARQFGVQDHIKIETSTLGGSPDWPSIRFKAEQTIAKYLEIMAKFDAINPIEQRYAKKETKKEI